MKDVVQAGKRRIRNVDLSLCGLCRSELVDVVLEGGSISMQQGNPETRDNSQPLCC